MYQVIYSPVETGQNIAFYRNLRNLTPERFAQMLNLDTDAVIEIENGIREISVPMIAKICTVLCVPADWILGFEERNE